MKNKICFSSLIILSLVLMLANSCKKNDSSLLTIGKSYQGGIIAYILQPSDSGYNVRIQHGLIAAPSDQSAGILWWNGSYTTTGATSVAIGTGKSNTAAIIASQGADNYAASLCNSLTLGGYTDWYLPSQKELEMLYLNRFAIGGFTVNGNYWSSTELSSVYAWFEWFGVGVSNNYYSKANTYAVRAVRSF